jgi:hypothetical protein
MALPPNFPQNRKRPTQTTSFPEDLGEYFMTLRFEKNTGMGVTGSTLSNLATSLFNGGLRLPLPKKINDVQSVIYEPVSGTSAGLSLVSGGGEKAAAIAAGLQGTNAAIAGSFAGIALNPHLIMLFKQPTFKEFSFSWSFTPKNQKEAGQLLQILDTIKKNMLPARSSGLLLLYPNKVMISVSGGYFPNIMKFKPAVISSINIDYTGSGAPSFFEDGMPTVINLTMQIKEIEVWFNEESTGSAATLVGAIAGAAIGNFAGGFFPGKYGAAIGTVIGGAVGAAAGYYFSPSETQRLNNISNLTRNPLTGQ